MQNLENPTAGGRYLRLPDGSLQRIPETDEPAEPAEAVEPDEPAEHEGT